MAARVTWLLVFTIAITSPLTTGCAGSRSWHDGSADSAVAEFLLPELVGESARVVTQRGPVEGRIVEVDHEGQQLLVRTTASAFEEGDSLGISFGDIQAISVSNHGVTDRRVLRGFAVFLSVALAVGFALKGFGYPADAS